VKRTREHEEYRNGKPAWKRQVQAGTRGPPRTVANREQRQPEPDQKGGGLSEQQERHEQQVRVGGVHAERGHWVDLAGSRDETAGGFVEQAEVRGMADVPQEGSEQPSWSGHRSQCPGQYDDREQPEGRARTHPIESHSSVEVQRLSSLKRTCRE